MKEHAAYDNLPAKQRRWEISPCNARDLSWTRQPASHMSSVSDTCWVPMNFLLKTDEAISARQADIFRK